MPNDSRIRLPFLQRWGATAAMLCFVALFSQTTLGSGSSGTACQRSSLDMRHSCLFEAQETLKSDIANCRQLDSGGERRECWHDAYAERRDSVKTCGDQLEARWEVCETLGEGRYADPLTDAAVTFIDPDDIPSVYPNNPYVRLQVGSTYVIEEEEELIVVHVTDEAREIQGVLCRVVVDVAVEPGEDEEGDFEYVPVEVTDDWFAQDTDANVYYCGEVSRNFEDGVLRDIDGSFEAGVDHARGGLLTMAMPVETAHRQEFALGVAEDLVEYVALNATPGAEEGGENEAFPCVGGCLKTLEYSPLEPEDSEFKYYLPGVGFVLAVAMEDGEVTGDRETVVCRGDSLAVLGDPSCGIEEPEILLDDLCELHPAFCPDEDD